ncbi:MarR family winged helix-turn-helix transcriptional regulator [Cohnella mopanensis]|uniref:MarR family winged helix-turn-helix transcriptional regulator n=1 Tax=Cohnella mopanensis TaxID=2911966 RepID=UPI001EF93076|nr:MarR family transcriptional regulator [Cohnella mopanensis]
MNNKPKINDRTTNQKQSIGRLIMQLNRLERQPKAFGEAGPLTPSEIHTIDAIGREGGVLMSELAQRLAVTKGAVTQLIGRLEAKDLVSRKSHPVDSRATVLSLTGLGMIAFEAHESMNQQFNDLLQEEFSTQEIEIFEKGLEKLIRLMS